MNPLFTNPLSAKWSMKHVSTVANRHRNWEHRITYTTDSAVWAWHLCHFFAGYHKYMGGEPIAVALIEAGQRLLYQVVL